MPQRFREKYSNTSCIIYCIETTLWKPHNLDSRGESCSHSRNTLMYLVAIAPCGLVVLISAYGGRCSNKFIIPEIGLLKYLHLGDQVMADRGFIIRDLLFEKRVNLFLQRLLRKEGKLSGEDVIGTRKIAIECIPME